MVLNVVTFVLQRYHTSSRIIELLGRVPRILTKLAQIRTDGSGKHKELVASRTGNDNLFWAPFCRGVPSLFSHGFGFDDDDYGGGGGGDDDDDGH